MPGMMPMQAGASHPHRTRLDGIMGTGHDTAVPKDARPGEQPRGGPPPATGAPMPGVEQQHVVGTTTNRLDRPGDGLDHLNC